MSLQIPAQVRVAQDERSTVCGVAQPSCHLELQHKRQREQVEYVGLAAAIAAVDEEERRLYAYMQKQPGGRSISRSARWPWYLVALDLDHGGVVAAPEAGNYYHLPWSIEVGKDPRDGATEDQF